MAASVEPRQFGRLEPGSTAVRISANGAKADPLRRCGVMPRKGTALNVCFEGLPGSGGSMYSTSITRERALDPSWDIMLAYLQNGEPLLLDHGFPVRVIIPVCIGGRIIVTTAESDKYYHYQDAELTNAEALCHKPEDIINELNINSVITSPGHVTTQRAYTMRGGDTPTPGKVKAGKMRITVTTVGFILILFGAGVALINSFSTAQDGDTYTALIGLVGVLGGVNLLALGFWMPNNRTCALCVWQNLGILGVVMASSAVTVVVAGAANPVLCFGLFVMLLAGLSLAACGVLGA